MIYACFSACTKRLAKLILSVGQKIGASLWPGVRIPLISAFFAGLLLSTGAARAEVYHISAGAEAGDGSASAPWGSLEAALASGRLTGGDELRLATGQYGDVVLSGWRFDTPLRIVADMRHQAHLTHLEIERSRNLYIEGLAIWPLEMGGRGPMVRTDARSAHITLSGLDVRSRETAAGYPTWDLAGWEASKRGGMFLRGPDNRVEGSRFLGVYHGIATTGERAVVLGNLIQGFAGDGLRGLGDGSVYQGNRIQDCVQIDGNHADGFQSWSLGGENNRPGQGVVTDITLRGNMILEWASSPVSPLRCSLQGIGLFDGMFEDFVIENNLIFVSAYHGIAVAGGINTRIVNNTLVNPRDPGLDRPWLSISPHKNGTLSVGGIVANNITPRLRLVEMDRSRMTVVQNLIGPYPGRYLQAPLAGNWRPQEGGAPIDAGDARFAPAYDIEGRVRPQGDGVDIGAFEGP